MTPTRDNVQCISVGDEFHCVENDHHELLTSVSNLTEQCDNCGGADEYLYDDRGQTSLIRQSVPGYSCILCGRWYGVEVREASEVVFEEAL